MTPIGRNALCLCGSGKKYKKCCLGKVGSPVADGVPGAALDEIRRLLEEQEFSSLDEMQAYADTRIETQNRAPREDFCGLSADQVYRMLNHPFSSPKLVTFPSPLATQPEAPILTIFSMLAEAIGEKGLKATAKGNLPRNFCREAARSYWDEDVYQKNTFLRTIYMEEDFRDLAIARHVGEMAGLIRKYRGRFILSRDCRKLISGPGLTAIYPRLFRAYVERYNWAYRDCFPEIFFVQHSFCFSLYLLNSYGQNWRHQTFYEDRFLRAFPQVLKQATPNPVFGPEKQVRSAYTHRALRNFAVFLGLVEMECTGDDPYLSEYRLRALPLLNEVVRFHFIRRIK